MNNAVITENPIDALITQAESEALSAAEQRQAEIDARVQELNQKIADALGEAWYTLRPYRRTGVYKVNNRTCGSKCDQVALTVPFEPADLELAPFWAHTATDRGVTFSKYDSYSGGTLGQPQHLGAFFLERRQAYPEWRKEWLKKQTEPLEDRLYWRDHKGKGITTLEEAEKALAQLIDLDPARKEDWQEAFAFWLRQTDYYDTQAREAEAAKARETQGKTDYLAAYRAFVLEYRESLALNRALFEALRAELDQPYTVWELTYGVVGGDDGVQEVETRQVYVAASRPDADGDWQVYERGIPQFVFYFRPVSVRGPLIIKPSERVFSCYRSRRISAAQATIEYGPGVDIDQVLERYDFKPLPEKPDWSALGITERYIAGKMEQQVASELGLPALDSDGYEDY